MEFIDGVTSKIINFSLDIALENHKAISSNIANSNVEGYQKIKLNFSEALEEVKKFDLTELSRLDGDSITTAIGSYTPSYEFTGDKVKLDSELINLNKNMIYYESLLRAKKGLGSILSSAISGSK